MKKTIFLLFLLTSLTNLLFGGNGSIDKIILHKDHIEITVQVDLENQNVIPTKMVLEKKSINNPWLAITTFDNVNNLKYLDYDVENGVEYAYRLVVFNKQINERGEIVNQRSLDSLSEFRKRIYWTAPEPDLNFRASDYGLTNNKRYDAFISVYLSGENKGRITKPLFILDGFDPSNARSVFNNATSATDGRGLYHLADGMQNKASHFYDGSEPLSQKMLDEFQSRCYDIIFIDWIEGAGDIAQNAELFENIIEHFNSVKNSGNKNVVLAPSMGGLIARYALADMEEKGLNHDFKLYISLDSPHKGANIPLGIQELMNQASSNSLVGLFKIDAIQKAKDALNTKAAKQMLIYHYKATNYYSPRVPRPSYEFTDFFMKLNALNNGKGWPENCLKIGISNGSGDNRDRFFADNRNFIGIGNLLMSAKIYPVSNPNKLVVSSSKNYKLSVVGLQIDNAPGGYSDLPYILNAYSVNKNTKNNNDRNCFIPVPSALGLPISRSNLNFNWVWNKSYDQLELTKAELAFYGYSTPFDICMVQNKNQQHIFIGKNTKKLTLKYLDIKNVTDVFVPHNSDLELIEDERTDGGLNVQLCEKFGSKSLNVISGANYSVQAQESIVWHPGFSVHLGATHVSEIVDSIYSDCEIPVNNFRSFNPVFMESEPEILSIEESNSLIGIKVSPNPTKGEVKITKTKGFGDNARLDVIDSRGRVVKSVLKFDKDIKFDFSEFENGIYYIKIKDSNSIELKKIVKI